MSHIGMWRHETRFMLSCGFCFYCEVSLHPPYWVGSFGCTPLGQASCFVNHGYLLKRTIAGIVTWVLTQTHWSYEVNVTGAMMAERNTPLTILPVVSSGLAESSRRPNPSDENGLLDSPDETLSSTSVIYFKEALDSSNTRFGKVELLSPSPLRQHEFHIQTIESKRRSKFQPIWYGLSNRLA